MNGLIPIMVEIYKYNNSSFEDIFKRFVSASKIYLGVINGGNYDRRDDLLFEEFLTYDYEYFRNLVLPFITSSYYKELQERYNDFLRENNIGKKNLELEIYREDELLASAGVNLDGFLLYNLDSSSNLKDLIRGNSLSGPVITSDNYLKVDRYGILEDAIRDSVSEPNSNYDNGTQVLSLKFFYYLENLDYFTEENLERAKRKIQTPIMKRDLN